MARATLRVAALALVALALAPALALAQPEGAPAAEGVRLVYVAEAIPGCPDEAELRALVASRIGGVPYVADGAWEVQVGVRAAEGVLEAQVSLRGPDGVERGRHALTSEGDCAALMTSVALTLSLVHDMVRDELAHASATRPARDALEGRDGSATTRSTGTSASADRTRAHTASASARSSREPGAPDEGEPPPPRAALPALRWWLGLGALVGYGLLPSASVGLRAFAALGGRALVVRLGLRADLPRPLNEGEPVLRLGWVLASLAVCGRYRALMPCALARLSVAYVPPAGEPRTTFPRSVGAGLGAELGVRLWARERSMLQAHVGFAVPLERTRVRVDGALLFRERPLDLTAGLALAWGQP